MQKYSQNDPKYKKTKIGNTSLSLGGWGCNICSICTLASYFGDTITPPVMAGKAFLFNDIGQVLWARLDLLFEHISFFMRSDHFNEKAIDDYLINRPDTCVILNVDHGYHFVAALGKTQSGYRCADSYIYPTKIRVYPKSDIIGFRVLIRK